MIKTINKISKILFITLVLGALLLVVLPGKVFADECESDGPYGEICNKTFEVEKKVKIEGGDVWKDKVINVKEDETILFRITIKNIGDVKVDDMKMEDFLPDELKRIGGSGLTEYWDDFEPGEEKEFEIEVKINSEEFDRDVEFEKCVVNKAEATYDGTLEGSDTATVCYGTLEIEELPETGATSTVVFTILGLALVTSGIYFKKKSRV